MKHHPSWSEKYQIRTFQDCEVWARDALKRYLEIKSAEVRRGVASYWLASQVENFTQRMQSEGRIDRIHESLLIRFPKVNRDGRDAFGVIGLLLSLANPMEVDRSKRCRICREARQCSSRLSSQKSQIGY